MVQKTQVFTRGRRQYIVIPAAFRSRSPAVWIRHGHQTGDVILSEVPPLDEVFAALDATQMPEDFLREPDRDQRQAEARPVLDHFVR